MITCRIRYEIDPFNVAAFEECAREFPLRMTFTALMARGTTWAGTSARSVCTSEALIDDCQQIEPWARFRLLASWPRSLPLPSSLRGALMFNQDECRNEAEQHDQHHDRPSGAERVEAL